MAYRAEDIEKMLKFIACIIDVYGDEYWPIFDRLEVELEQIRSRETRLKSYLEPIERQVTDQTNY